MYHFYLAIKKKLHAATPGAQSLGLCLGYFLVQLCPIHSVGGGTNYIA